MQRRWLYQLGVLCDALDGLDALHEQWLSTLDSLPAGVGAGTPAYDEALAEHNAECWSYLRASAGAISGTGPTKVRY